LRISAAREGDTLHLACMDNGAGMQPDQVARVFEPFYTTRRSEGGSGLGLYICYNIVHEQLDGSIECESSPETGCRFDIRFSPRFTEGPHRPAA
jgi:signal transduction histidine kinase